MKRIIFSLIIMVVLTACIVPQAVYGADGQESNLLTPNEQAFMQELSGLHGTIDRILTNNSQVTGEKYRKIREVYWGQRMLLKGPISCEVTFPDTFKQVGNKWNSEVCPAFLELQNDLVSTFDEALEEDRQAVWGTIESVRLNDRLGILGERLNQVQEKAGVVFELASNRAQELTSERRELQKKAEEKAKELTGEGDKGETGDNGSNGDEKDTNGNGESEDLFDTDCFIATAAYDNPAANEINVLRQFRDKFLLNNHPGKSLVAVYYEVSPPMAEFISRNEVLRVVVREGFVDHIVTAVDLTESWWVK
jgi:hypothetical protein